MSDDDMEDYGFEYSDEDAEEQDVDIENNYYNSKGLVTDGGDLSTALRGFQEVVRMEDGKGEWGFKALKQIVKLHYKMGNHEEMLTAYREMLAYIKSSAVTRNASEKKINSLLDFVAQSTDMSLLQNFYGTTLEALAEAKNERLWFKTQLKLCGLWFKLNEYGRLARILKELHKSCQSEDGSDDLKKGTQLLEVYALEIQLHSAQKNTKKLKELYHRALTIKSAIPHPRIMGIIRECGGKMHMHERDWQDAKTDFFEAFKNYDEAGVARRVQCLKYLVLASMLMGSQVDPFDAQEAKPYKNDSQVLAMTNLVAAYQSNNIAEFEKILATNKATINDDLFIRNYIEDLLRNIRTQVVLAMVGPFTRIRIPYVSQKLNIPEGDVEQLLVALILDGKIHGRIDQVNHLLELDRKASTDEKYTAVDKWAKHVSTLHAAVVGRLS
ncbi:hypothetical protein WJX73_004702 [Symbiochloris irregularis]|uniref:COP9 signalosome complex subunit 2 n=1 Tax=Symbiochloris irregularis TaxID=706552 RepID=A0AAW1NPF0_9CHLO